MDMSGWFANYVRGVETLPYDEAFSAVGLRLVRTPANQPYTAGIVTDRRDTQALRLGAIRTGSPAESAGLQEGDILVTIGGTDVSRGNWLSVLNRFKQGDRVPVTVRRFHRTVDLTIQLGPPDEYDYKIEELPGAPPEAKRLRTAWLEGN
jgi:predicted metalloprotease with PDZ domain